MIDVLMGQDGDLPIPSYLATGVEIIAQRVRCRLLTWLGDWTLDVNAGVDYFAYLGTKPAPLATLTNAVAREIRTTPGVVNVLDIESSQVGGTATISATVVTADGSFTATVMPVSEAGNPSVTVGGVLGHSTRITR